jgi:TRAP-type C4-dicarboxylate transport system substrate-binding protein
MTLIAKLRVLAVATTRPRIFAAARIAAMTIALLLPSAATAEPISLNLSFFTSDRSVAYLTAVKPFVDAINSEGEGLLKIVVYPSGALGKVQRELPQQVLNGAADIAFIVPGQNPELFSDTAVVGLPGLFRDVREATMTYTRLLAENSLLGYQDFFVIGAYATQPETIHSRKPIHSIADLNGQKIRANNPTEATALAKLGAVPVVLAFNETTPALSSGALDGATVPVTQLFDVGIGRLTSNHYLLGTSAAPLTLMMNRKVFDRLPEAAKTLIRKYSGEWAASSFIEAYEAIDKKIFAEIKLDTRRNIVLPSAADQKVAQAAFKAIIQDWAGASAHNRELLKLTEADLAKVRDSELGKIRAESLKDKQ